MLTVKELFDLEHSLGGRYLQSFSYPWEALDGIGALILDLGAGLDREEFMEISQGVWVHYTSKLSPGTRITGPCIIGAETELRPGAYIRGSALVGTNCVVGNSTELKNVILFDGVQVPHYNYVGDSILGYQAHMGAGAITSNVKADRSPVVIHGEKEFPTGRKKVGAMVGDFAEIGCNAVLNPGTVLGRHAQVYPLANVRGLVPSSHIYKREGQVVERKNGQ